MKPGALALSRLRATASPSWLAVLFGIAYIISQVTILIILEPLGVQFAKLQCFGFSAETYLAVFLHWEETGVMAAYKAHFVIDDVHWLWYTGLFTVLLCRLFQNNQIPHRFDWLLLLPLASGLLDWYENSLQHVFLSSPNFSTIVDPLPLLSTIASDIKWTLALTYVLLTLVLLFRGRSRRASEAAA